LQDRHYLDDVFYRILDSDESLKVRQLRVRQNGALITSAVDVGVIAAIGFVLHLIVTLISRDERHLLWAMGMASLSVFSTLTLVPVGLDRHLRLSNDQLNYIDAHHSDDVLSLTNAILLTMS
jgi:hypothetical protein